MYEDQILRRHLTLTGLKISLSSPSTQELHCGKLNGILRKGGLKDQLKTWP